MNINKTSNRLFPVLLQLMLALIAGGATWWLLRQDVLAAKPWFWRQPSEPAREWFAAEQSGLMPLTLILAAFTAVSGVCFVRLWFTGSRYISKLGFIALSYPLLDGLAKGLALVGAGIVSLPSYVARATDPVAPYVADMLAFAWLANFLPIAPMLALTASIVSVARKRQFGNLVAIPYTVAWWLLVYWFELTLIGMQND